LYFGVITKHATPANATNTTTETYTHLLRRRRRRMTVAGSKTEASAASRIRLEITGSRFARAFPVPSGLPGSCRLMSPIFLHYWGRKLSSMFWFVLADTIRGIRFSSGLRMAFVRPELPTSFSGLRGHFSARLLSSGRHFELEGYLKGPIHPNIRHSASQCLCRARASGSVHMTLVVFLLSMG